MAGLSWWETLAPGQGRRGDNAAMRSFPTRAIAVLLIGCLAAAAHGRQPADVSGDPAPVAKLVLEPRDGATLAWAENRLAGPIEVMLHATGDVPPSDPALPARATVPARGRTLVARVGPSPARGAHLDLRAVPGHPNVRTVDVEYGWPLEGAPVRIAQGWGGASSHRDAANRHAIDLTAPVGTPVVAARDGVVMQVEAGFTHGAADPRLDGRANFVRVLHGDGTMALYAHLDANGVFVRPGDRVRRGERLGLSGSTGFSSGPHLHFVVQANRGMRLESLPFRMFGPGGVLRFHDPGP